MVITAAAEVASYDVWADIQHVAIVLGILVSFFGIWAGVRAWRKERVIAHAARAEAIVSRAKTEELLHKVSLEFENNHGSSMLDKIEDIGRTLKSHSEIADDHFKRQVAELHTLKDENQNQHDAIHRRIDGMFEMFVGGTANTPRKTAERHRNREEPS